MNVFLWIEKYTKVFFLLHFEHISSSEHNNYGHKHERVECAITMSNYNQFSEYLTIFGVNNELILVLKTVMPYWKAIDWIVCASMCSMNI